MISLVPISSYAYSAETENTGDSIGAAQLRDSGIPTSTQLDNAVPNQLIVTYKDDGIDIEESIEVAPAGDAPLAEIVESEPSENTTLSELGAVNLDVMSQSDESSERDACSLVTFEEGTDLQEVAAQLLSSPEVEDVQPNYEYELFAFGDTPFYDATATTPAYHPTNDPYSYVDESKSLNQSYIYTTKVADAWAHGYVTNSKVTVAVIDAGPRLDHPDLQPAWDLTYARDFTEGSSSDIVPYSDSPSYWEGKTGLECHGTWVSGLIAASANNGMGIAGTSYNARILPIKVTTGKTLSTYTIVRAYNYLDDLIEAGKVPSLKVINLSLGGRESDLRLKVAINHMTESHNILTVAAAGNYGDSDHMYPADYPNVLSVMAVDKNYKRAPFSNYGNKSVSAPGIDITTTTPYSSLWSSYDVGKYVKTGIDGTSFSTPIVSGVAAICYAMKPTASAMEIKYSITSGATSLKSIDSSCAPYLNALQAVKNLLSGKGLYEATHISISKAKVTNISNKTYSGKSKVPKPKVTLSGKTLKRGVDYSISYSNNKHPGKATVTIKGIGAYKGTKKLTFKILPKKSRITKLKGRHRSISVSWKRQKSCATGYQIRYSTSVRRDSAKRLRTGKTITIKGNASRSTKIKHLKKNTRYYVQVRVYKKSKGISYFSSWSLLRTAVAR